MSKRKTNKKKISKRRQQNMLKRKKRIRCKEIKKKVEDITYILSNININKFVI